jgi:hypothetical protein
MCQALRTPLDGNRHAVDFDHLARRKEMFHVRFGVRYASPR